MIYRPRCPDPPSVIIQDVEGPEAAAIGQAVMHEVHGPHVVDLVAQPVLPACRALGGVWA